MQQMSHPLGGGRNALGEEEDELAVVDHGLAEGEVARQAVRNDHRHTAVGH